MLTRAVNHSWCIDQHIEDEWCVKCSRAEGTDTLLASVFRLVGKMPIMLIVSTVTGTSGLTTSPMHASGLTSPMTHIWAHNQPDAQGERSTRHFTAEGLLSGKVSGPSLVLCKG